MTNSVPHSVARVVKLSLQIALLAGFVGSAFADDNSKEAKRFQALQQRFSEERSQWETERSNLQKKLSDAQAELAALKGEDANKSAQLSAATRERGKLAQNISELSKQKEEAETAHATELKTRNAEQEAFANARKQERIAANNRYDLQTKELSTCAEKNDQLVDLAHDLLQQYRAKGVTEALLGKEPVIGVGEVETFNLVQETREKIDSHRVNTNHSPSGTGSAKP